MKKLKFVSLTSASCARTRVLKFNTLLTFLQRQTRAPESGNVQLQEKFLVTSESIKLRLLKTLSARLRSRTQLPTSLNTSLFQNFSSFFRPFLHITGNV